MKKTILSVALAALLTAPAVMAQHPGARQLPPPDTSAGQCPPGVECPQAPQGEAPEQPKWVDPFGSLNLSDKQKQQVQELSQKYAPLTPRQLQEQRLQKRKDYLKDLKSILSKDQYTDFLENYYVNTPGPRNGLGKPCKQRKDGKGGKDKKDCKGRQCQKQQAN